MSQLYEVLAEDLRLSEADREVRNSSSRQKTYHNRIAWARTQMVKAGLLESPRRGWVQVTALGLRVLEEPPDRFDYAFFKKFPSFVEFHSGEAQPGSDEFTHELEEESVSLSCDGVPVVEISAAIGQDPGVIDAYLRRFEAVVTLGLFGVPAGIMARTLDEPSADVNRLIRLADQYLGDEDRKRKHLRRKGIRVPASKE